MIRIQKFRKQDARKVSHLIGKALIEVNSKDYPKSIIKNLCTIFSPLGIIKFSKKRDIHLAYKSNKILGCASLENNIISTVFVNPAYHGKGVGKKLVQYLEKLAERKDHKSIRIPSSITAFKFYKKLGYKMTAQGGYLV